MPTLQQRFKRARRHKRMGHTLGELVTSGSKKEIRTACKNIKCAPGRVCYCAAFVVPPDCWCDAAIVYSDGSTNASATSIKPIAASKACPPGYRLEDSADGPVCIPEKKKPTPQPGQVNPHAATGRPRRLARRRGGRR